MEPLVTTIIVNAVFAGAKAIAYKLASAAVTGCYRAVRDKLVTQQPDTRLIVESIEHSLSERHRAALALQLRSIADTMDDVVEASRELLHELDRSPISDELRELVDDGLCAEEKWVERDRVRITAVRERVRAAEAEEPEHERDFVAVLERVRMAAGDELERVEFERVRFEVAGDTALESVELLEDRERERE